MCAYRKLLQGNSQYCLVTTLINVTDMLTNNEATEVSYVSITALNLSSREYGQPYNYSISPNTKIGTLNATFYHSCLADEQIGVNLRFFDKCSQQSLSEEMNCTFLESEGMQQTL